MRYNNTAYYKTMTYSIEISTDNLRLTIKKVLESDLIYPQAQYEG